jgi:hypothetical protein
MKTTYYTVTAREVVVSGDGVQQVSGGNARQLVCLRTPAATGGDRGKVIDLAAWRADREEETWAADPAEARQPRPRRDHSRLRLGGDWLATASVIGAMVVLVARILG